MNNQVGKKIVYFNNSLSDDEQSRSLDAVGLVIAPCATGSILELQVIGADGNSRETGIMLPLETNFIRDYCEALLQFISFDQKNAASSESEM